MHKNGQAFKKIAFIFFVTFNFNFYQAKAADVALIELAKILIEGQNEYIDRIIDYNKFGSNDEIYDAAQLKERYLKIVTSDETAAKLAVSLSSYLSPEEAKQLASMWVKVRGFFKSDALQQATDHAMSLAQDGCPLDAEATSTTKDTQEDSPIVKVVSSADFTSKVLARKGKSIVKASAVWCGPCRQLKPIYHRLSAKYSTLAAFFEVDADDSEDLPSTLNIKGFPTLIFYQDGIEQKRVLGFQGETETEIAIAEFLK